MLSWLFSNPLAPGEPAPDFSLPDDKGEIVRLSELRGQNVALIFYPGDETPVCRRQLCEFRDHWEVAQDSSVTVLGINPWSAASHKKFRERHGFPFPLLVDRGQKVAAAYGAKGLWVKRTVYLIGPDGVVRYAKRSKPPVEEVLQAAEQR